MFPGLTEANALGYPHSGLAFVALSTWADGHPHTSDAQHAAFLDGFVKRGYLVLGLVQHGCSRVCAGGQLPVLFGQRGLPCMGRQPLVEWRGRVRVLGRAQALATSAKSRAAMVCAAWPQSSGPGPPGCPRTARWPRSCRQPPLPQHGQLAGCPGLAVLAGAATATKAGTVRRADGAKRARRYGRVATQDQNTDGATSIADQDRITAEYVARKGWANGGFTHDEQTGTSTDRPPGASW
jgi:hypothetical protein